MQREVVIMSLGEKIRRARGRQTQAYLAEKLAVSVNTLSAYEKNRSLPSLEIFKQICKIYGLSADELLEIVDISNTPDNEGKMLDHKLANLRDQLDLTQEKMAALIGVSVSTWSKYETGNRTPPLNRFLQICKNCKVSADYLLGLKEKV